MKGILEDNANEAWSKAIVDCDDILEGRTTLGYRKSFVAHLHNSIELYIKQYMLNTNCLLYTSPSPRDTR